MAAARNKATPESGKVLLVAEDRYGNKHWEFFPSAKEAEQWLVDEIGDEGFHESSLEIADDDLASPCQFLLLPVTEQTELRLTAAGVRIEARLTSKL